MEEAVPGPHPFGALAAANEGWALYELGRVEEATDVLEKSSAFFDQNPIDPLVEAQVDFYLARALRERGEENRAEQLARSADAVFAERDPRWHAEAEAFLARR
jgi:hypothetical protein